MTDSQREKARRIAYATTIAEGAFSHPRQPSGEDLLSLFDEFGITTEAMEKYVVDTHVVSVWGDDDPPLAKASAR